jgi:formylglycine-generating enzyme required for sulfatase activity
MNKPLFRIFVSSTYIDLIDYRHAAEKAINDLGQKYEGMEYMGAMDEEPTRACLDIVEQCDLFIGIYAWRYGHVPDDSEFSITEQEYNHAQTLGRPCLCYLVNEDHPWPPKFIEMGPTQDKLKQFKNKISKEHVRDKFTTIENLKYNLSRDIGKWLMNNRPGLSRDALKPGEDPVKIYLEAIVKKYETLPMIGERSFVMDSIYIPLSVHVDPKYRYACQPDKTEEKLWNRSLKAEDLLNLSDKVAVVLGEPGMGKTTMLHYLALQVCKRADGLFPIFVKLADFSKTREPLESFLLATVGNYITGSTMQDAARNAIQEQQALILLDGLDEVNRNEYQAVTDKIRSFITTHLNCRVIITSRKAGFQSKETPYHIFEIDNLPFPEIEIFVNKWFVTGTDLAARIAPNPRIHELAQNPFLLSIICVIFEKDQKLPQRRLDLYEKCIAELLTRYNENLFTRRLKERVLKDLAYHFFCQGVDEFPYTPLIEQVIQTLAEMKGTVNEDEVLREIRENSGLLQQSDDNHLFVHRTFYEYYVSRKMRGDAPDAVLSRVAESRWEEPIRLYAAQIESITEGTQFLKTLWEKDRALALRCFPDMDRVEPELIKNLLNQANVNERVELVKGLPEKIAEPEKIVETLRELFRWETNGEVIYWGAQILEEREEIKKIPGALEIVKQKLDDGVTERYQEYLEKDMIPIPAGQFKMGGEEYESEKPVHEVKLDRFLISRYQITNRLYEMFDPNHRQRRDEYSDQDDQPVIYVNWYEAVSFCRWLGCRLPTEAEWEYACRAGTTMPFHTEKKLTADQANFNQKIGKTTSVGNYPPNEWGLYDMHGNVWEWCRDWYNEKFYNECKRQGIIGNPQGPETGSFRVLRGGSWYGQAENLRSFYRGCYYPDVRYDAVGFRVICVARTSK